MNPRATTTSPRVVDVIVHAFSAELDLDVTVTTHRGHGIALGERARSEGMDVVVTLGGDGIVNEVVNGLLGQGSPDDEATPGSPAQDRVPMLAAVPGGSANVFARALGLPNDAVEATGVLLESLRDGRARSIGVGRAGDRWFLANAGIGIDAEIIASMEEHRSAGRAATPLRYVTTTLAAYFRRTDRRHPALTLHRQSGIGDGVTEGVFFAVVQNAAPWTYLGSLPINPCPDASFDTGLDVFALRGLKVPTALVAASRMLRGSGRSTARGALVTWHDQDAFTVTADRPMALQIDGEGMGTTTGVRFTAHPEALRVVC